MRTAVNVMGDSYGAALVAHICRRELEQSHTAAFETPPPQPSVERKTEQDIIELVETRVP